MGNPGIYRNSRSTAPRPLFSVSQEKTILAGSGLDPDMARPISGASLRPPGTSRPQASVNHPKRSFVSEKQNGRARYPAPQGRTQGRAQCLKPKVCFLIYRPEEIRQPRRGSTQGRVHASIEDKNTRQEYKMRIQDKNRGQE